MNRALSCCGLASYPRWIEVEYHGAYGRYMCSNCGDCFNMRTTKLHSECKNCHALMRKSSYD